MSYPEDGTPGQRRGAGFRRISFEDEDVQRTILGAKPDSWSGAAAGDAGSGRRQRRSARGAAFVEAPFSVSTILYVDANNIITGTKIVIEGKASARRIPASESVEWKMSVRNSSELGNVAGTGRKTAAGSHGGGASMSGTRRRPSLVRKIKQYRLLRNTHRRIYTSQAHEDRLKRAIQTYRKELAIAIKLVNMDAIPAGSLSP